MDVVIVFGDNASIDEARDFLHEECGYAVSYYTESMEFIDRRRDGGTNVLLLECPSRPEDFGPAGRLLSERGEGKGYDLVLLCEANARESISQSLRDAGFSDIITTESLYDVPLVLEGRVKPPASPAGAEPSNHRAARAASRPSAAAGRERPYLRDIAGIGRIGLYSEHVRNIVSVAEQLHNDRSVSVLIEGETGTGKEIIARVVHHGPANASLPFVSLNCSAISPTLFETELFGYEGGAFTGSKKKGMIGKLELARGGTIYLDEIGDMPLEMQPKLLRALEEREIYRVGGITKIPLNVRVICSTNLNLWMLVQAGKFRRDLYFRLNAGTLHLKPLRETPEAILPLAQMFLESFSGLKRRSFKHISREAGAMLEEYAWPGNIRELKNTIECAILFYDDVVLTPEYLKFVLAEADAEQLPAGVPLKPGSIVLPPDRLDIYELESEIVRKTLSRFKGNKSKAAEFLGISRSTLRSWIKRLLPKYSE